MAAAQTPSPPSNPKPADEKKDKIYSAPQDLYRNVLFLEKMVQEHHVEKIPRVLNSNSRIRQALTNDELKTSIERHLSDSVASKAVMLNYVSASIKKDVEMKDKAPVENNVKIIATDLIEVEIYFFLLVLTKLFSPETESLALQCSQEIVQRCLMYNRRTLDALAAKAYFYFSYCHQKKGDLPIIREALLAAHRTACLRHDAVGQATLLNLLLRNYLSQNLYDQAFKLVSKTSFPESASNNQYVRYLYYVGKIQAVQLDYTDAHTKIMQALRKVPQNTALGFRREAQKLAIIIKLLMGEMPERNVFYQEGFQTALMPYFQLTNAVRVGNLIEFNKVTDQHREAFKQDKVVTLIFRLRHNVIKTGLRKISISYSRISFTDICSKLSLETPENAEFVCAKAIYDGVIDAVIDHERGWMQSKDLVDVYCTAEPQQAFQRRIAFCLDVHNEAVKAMRYPPDAYRKDLESAEERKKREKQDEELQKEIEEDLNDEEL